MMKISIWLNPKLLGLSLATSAPIAVVGEYLSPRFYSAGTDGKESGDTILLWTGAALAASVFAIFMLTLLFEASKKNTDNGHLKKPIGKAFSGLLGTIGLLLAVSLVISLLYGLLAVLIHAALKNTLSFEQIKGIINIATTIITLLILPVFFNIFFTYGTSKEKILKSFSLGLKSQKGRYVKMLLFIAVVFATGWLVTLPFRYVDLTLPIQLVRTVVLSIVGMLALVAAFAINSNIDTKIKWKKSSDKVPTIEVAVEEEKETVTV
jgi:hypothetical protein